MANVGYATLSIVPSIRGLANDLNRQLGGAGLRVGRQAGRDIARGISESQRDILRPWEETSRRMAATFSGQTSAIGRGLANFRAGFRDASAAASAFTGRMGSLGGAVRLELGAASAMAQRLGAGLRAVGAAAAPAMAPLSRAIGPLAAGFRSSEVAASALSGRLGSLGGLARSAVQPVVDGVGRFAGGFTNASAAASVFSGRLGSLGGLARTAVSGLSAGLSAAAGAMGRLGSAAGTGLGAAASLTSSLTVRVREGLGAAVANARAQVGGMGSAWTQMGAMAGAAVAAIGIGQLTRSVGQLGTQIQDTRISLTGMYGDAGLARDTVAAINSEFGASRIGAPTFLRAAQTLAYLGIEGEQARNMMRQMNIAVQAVGGGESHISSITSALAKAQNQGNAFNGELNMISEAGFPIFQELGALLGKTGDEIKTMAAEGKISYEMLLEVFKDPTEDAFQRATRASEELENSFTGSWARAKGTFLVALGEMVAGFLDGYAGPITTAGEKATAAVQGLPGLIGEVKAALADWGVVDAFESLRDAAASIADGAGPAVRGFFVGFGATLAWVFTQLEPVYDLLDDFGTWMTDNESTVDTFGVALGGLTAGFVAFRAAVIASNLALRVSPLGWVVLGISALAGAVAWLNTSTGTTLVTWDSFMTTIEEGHGPIGKANMALQWLGETAAFIGEGFYQIGLATIDFFAFIGQGVWDLALGIWDVFVWLFYDPGLGKVVWDGLMSIGDAFVWLYDYLVGNSVVPDMAIGIMSWFSSMSTGSSSTVSSMAIGIGASMVSMAAGMVSNAQSAGRTVVSNLASMASGASARARDARQWVSDQAEQMRSNAVNRSQELARGVRSAFQTAVAGIRSVWSQARRAAADPVTFMVETVYNKGIVGLWNKVADKVPGLSRVSTMKTPKGMARGGILPGTSTWRQGDDQLVPMRRGEGVYVSEAMRDPYERARLQAVNRAAMSGQSLERFRDGVRPHSADYRQVGDIGAFARGGVVGYARGGIIGEWLSKKWDDIVGGLEGWATKPFNRLSKSVTDQFGKGNDWHGVGHGMLRKFRSGILSVFKKQDEEYMMSMAGGADSWVGLASASERLQRAAKWARTQHGKRYQWGGAGNPSWDCSGFVAAIENVIRGLRPGRRYTTHSFGGSPPAGWVRNLKSPFTTGVKHGGRGGGHMAGTLMGVNVESGGRGVQVGSGAQGTNNFPNRFGFKPVTGDKTARGKAMGGIVYDDGGLLKPGLQLVYNGTGKAETIRTAEQEARVERLLAALEHNGTGNVINVTPPPATVGELVDGVSYALRRSRRGGVHAGVR